MFLKGKWGTFLLGVGVGLILAAATFKVFEPPVSPLPYRCMKVDVHPQDSMDLRRP